MYITNDEKEAQLYQNAGVERIFVDLEKNGKEERQPGDTVKSDHTMEDVRKIRKSISTSKLLVRINPIFSGTEKEIEELISIGADYIMLPFFKTVEEVSLFIKFVNGRAKTVLLLETPEAVLIIDEILSLSGIDEIHIGLNDLSLGYHKKFMFELLSDGTVEYLAKKIKNKMIPFGFGGISRLGGGLLPAEKILLEHIRLGSQRVILSRNFSSECRKFALQENRDFNEVVGQSIDELNQFIARNQDKSIIELDANMNEIRKINEEVVNKCNFT